MEISRIQHTLIIIGSYIVVILSIIFIAVSNMQEEQPLDNKINQPFPKTAYAYHSTACIMDKEYISCKKSFLMKSKVYNISNCIIGVDEVHCWDYQK